MAPAPVAPQDRILAIDVLRGIALFGVLAINLATEFRVSIFQRFLPTPPSASWIDRIIESILMIGIDSKAFALFSFLFGVGLAIQFDHFSGSSRRLVLLLRRLLVLLIIGVIHLVLIWNGDILVEYALAGFIVLPFLFGPKRLLVAAAAIGLGLYFLGPLLPLWSLPSRSWMARHVAEAIEVYGSGGFVDVLSFRIREVPAIVPLHVMVFPRTLALMLLGVVAWRSGAFERTPGARRMLARGAVLGIALGGAIAISVASHSLGSGRGTLIAERASTILLAGGYGAIVIWAVNYTGAGRLLTWAAPVGRMAFTNYLMQSVIFGWIFYGYGLGFFGKLGIGAAMAIGIAVYVAQVVMSALWLRSYLFGPVEWTWRSAMYGRVQAFKRTSPQMA
jgi:uncharacterized protein